MYMALYMLLIDLVMIIPLYFLMVLWICVKLSAHKSIKPSKNTVQLLF